MLSLFKRKAKLPRPPKPQRQPMAVANPLFALQPVEPRLLLSGDPITGIFDNDQSIDLNATSDSQAASAELSQALADLADSAINVEADNEAIATEKSNFEQYVKPVNERGFYISTADDVDTNPGQDGGSDSWTAADVVSATGTSFATASGGALFQQQFDVANYIDNATLTSVHYVTTAVSVDGFTFQAGDVLFTIEENAGTVADGNGSTFSAHRWDILLFRPDTVGDYSAGEIYEVIDRVDTGNSVIQALTLVEQDTTVAGVDLEAGNLLLVHSDGTSIQRIYDFDFLGLIGSVSYEDFITDNSSDDEEEDEEGDEEEDDVAIGDSLTTSGILGLELFETEQTVGGVTYTAGTLLVASDDEQGLVSLTFSGSSSSLEYSDATAAMAWSYEDALDGETSIDALSVADAITYINQEPTGSITIDGSATEDQTLSLNWGDLADDDGFDPATATYQWLRNGVAIVGATNSEYTLSDADVGANIALQVTYVDDWGTTEQVTSAATAAVANINDAPGGAPTIDGTAAEYETLTAVVSGVTDDDGFNPDTADISYQWLRDGAAITDATAQTYSLTDADIGAQLSVQITYTDGNGSLEQLTSATTEAVANVNDAPVGQPYVWGWNYEGYALSAWTQYISDADGLGTFSYQWLRDGAVIDGATQWQYTLTADDVGAQMSVMVSYVDGHGTLEQLSSTYGYTIKNTNDAPTGDITLDGVAAQGSTLTANTDTLQDDDGLGAFSYQWYRDGEAISGATEQSYLLQQADVGHSVYAQVSYTDGGGSDEVLSSNASESVANINDLPLGSVLLSGTRVEGNTLTAVTDNLTDDDGIGDFSYQWLRNNQVIGGAQSATYTLTQNDVGSAIAVQVSYVDGYGTTESVTSTATVSISDSNVAPTGGITVLGSTVEGNTLSVDTSTLADANGLGEFSWQWLRNGVAIDGATQPTYTLLASDVGSSLAVQVSYIDGEGQQETVTSATTAAISDSNVAPTGGISISGSAEEGAVLSVDTSALADANGLGEFSWQWLRNGAAIDGATQAAYTLVAADIGASVAVQVSYIDGEGQQETVVSAFTSAVSNVDDPLTGSVLVQGLAVQGQTLTADTSQLADLDGISQLTFQWLRDDTAIDGASSQNYQLQQADVGRSISVQVIAQDNYGATSVIDTQAAAGVANVNDSVQGRVQVSGAALVGETLTANASDLSDADGLGVLQYQWLRNGEMITDANSASYTLTQADADAEITVVVSYKDGYGETEQVQSQAVVAQRVSADKTLLASAGQENTLATAAQTPVEDPTQAPTGSEQNTENQTAQADNTDQTELSDVSADVTTVALDQDQNKDFTQKIFAGFETDLGDSSSGKQLITEVSINLLQRDSFFTPANDDWFNSDSVANLDQFLDPMVLVNNTAVSDSFDQLRKQFVALTEQEQVLWTGTTTLTASFSVGYAVWLLRSGVLISTALSAIPAWRFIDPLPILMSGSHSAQGDGESLESMVSGSDADDDEHKEAR